MNILPESRTMEVKNLIWNVDQQVDKMAEEATSCHRQLEEVNRKWKTFDTLMESVGKWMEDAEGLIKNGTLKACKVRYVEHVTFRDRVLVFLRFLVFAISVDWSRLVGNSSVG